jgi:P4 family phage/plasmid primase-like protien
MDSNNNEQIDAVTQAKIAMANMAISQGKMTVKEAEELFGITLVEKTPFDEAYPNHKNGFYEINYKQSRNGDTKIEYIPKLEEIARYFRDELKMKWTDAYRLDWNGKKFELLDESVLDNRIGKLTNGILLHAPDDIRKIKLGISIACGGADDDIQNEGLINLDNGVFNVKEGRLMVHDIKYGFKYVLPYAYDENAKCPLWIDTLNTIFDGDQERICVVQEFFGDILRGGRPKYHKALANEGNGSNGKSVIASVLTKLVGRENYSSVELSDLERPNARAQLFGKLVNICGETSRRSVESSHFKAIVSGDPITAKILYKDELTFTPTCRLFFNLNNDPKFGEYSHGLMRRLLIIPYEKTFGRDHEDNKNIFEELDSEIVGIFNWALEGAIRLDVNKRFTESVKSNDSVEMLHLNSCTVYSFIDHIAPYNDEPYKFIDQWVEVDSYYPIYVKYCADMGLFAKGKPWFSRIMSGYIRQQKGASSVVTVGRKVRTGWLKPAGVIEGKFLNSFAANNKPSRNYWKD